MSRSSLLFVLCLLFAAPAAAQNVRRVTSTIPPPSGAGAVVTVIAGQSIASAITAAGAGGVILLKAGTHRVTSALTPLNNQVFIGEKDSDGTRRSRLNGSRILTGWIADSGRWYVTGQTQAGTLGVDMDCDDGTPEHPIAAGRFDRCVNPEQLYFNCSTVATCTMKHHETSLAATGAGEWFFDYAADRIYVGDDPTSAFVETAVTQLPFTGSASGVTVRGLVVEMFASVSQDGTIYAKDNWLVDDNEIRWNHGAGIRMSTLVGARVRNNYIHHNCNYAITGEGLNLVVDGNEFAYNNVLPQSNDWETAPCGFWSFWGAGGTKFVHTLDLLVRDNYSHHNNGPGVWFDIENRRGIIRNNVLESNRRAGIFWEISCSAAIHNNWAIGNGTGLDFPGIGTGAGIEINTSADVLVYDNVITGNAYGITGTDDIRNGGNEAGGQCQLDGVVWKLANLYVHDNIITSCGSSAGVYWTGVTDSGHGTDAFSGAQNNDFEDNVYTLGAGTNYFNWASGNIATAAWTALGHDDSGSFGSCP